MIQLDTVYQVLVDYYEDTITSCLKDGKDVFQLSFKDFAKALKAETGCCDLTAKGKWEILEVKGIIQPYNGKCRNAWVMVRPLLTATGFYDKNKKIKIKISHDADQEAY